jgi:hypothetical protein
MGGLALKPARIVCTVASLILHATAWAAGHEQILNDFSIDSIQNAERARTALSATADARRGYLEQWQIQTNDCRNRLAVTRCQGQLKSDRQAFESRLGAIDIHARQILRNASLTERNSAEARSSAEPPAQAAIATPASSAEQRAQRVSQHEARLSQHEASLARQKAAGMIEAKRRQEKLAELNRRRLEHARKLAEARARAGR